MTSSKFSAELTSIVKDKLQIAPDERISIRVFLEDDAILEKVTAELDAKGMEINNVEEGPDVLVTGAILVKDLPDINAITEVDRVEYDRSV